MANYTVNLYLHLAFTNALAADYSKKCVFDRLRGVVRDVV